MLYKNQIAALEESKSLLMTEVITLRGQMKKNNVRTESDSVMDMTADDLKLKAADESELTWYL